jgi:hypothetical protein
MRLFVGTLFSGENEFEECITSITKQTYKNYKHFIFKNLSKKGGHEILFQTFMGCANEYDILIKVDADMVIEDSNFFEKVIEKFNNSQLLSVLTIAVHDFFSDRLIIGLPTYRNNVKWRVSGENLFMEIPPVSQDQIIADFVELAPAAVHCKNPSPFQAFHYGMHRGLKVVQPGREDKRLADSKVHWDSLELTWQNFIRRRDIRLGFACLGAELSFLGKVNIQHLDYSNLDSQKIFTQYENLNIEQLFKKVRGLRLLNLSFLPDKKRRIALQYMRGGARTNKEEINKLIYGMRW